MRNFNLAMLLCVVVFSQCTPVYIPNIVNTPMLNNKGELQAAVYTSTSGFDPQLSYATSDNFGVMLNGSFADRGDDNSTTYHKHNFVELGAGYFTSLGLNGRFEFYGGYGFGNIDAEYHSGFWDESAHVNNSRVFLQPTIGFSSKFVEFSFATRYAHVFLKQGSRKNNGMYLEPVTTLKLGHDNFRGIMQLGFSAPLNSGTIEFDYQPLIIGFGLQANLFRKRGDGKKAE